MTLKQNNKLLRIITLLAAVILYSICFKLNFNAESLEHVELKLCSSILLLATLLPLSFLYANSRRYILIVTSYFSCIFITTIFSLILRNQESLWKYIFFGFPTLSFLTPFTPILQEVPVLGHPIIACLFVYGIILLMYTIGHNKQKA